MSRKHGDRSYYPGNESYFEKYRKMKKRNPEPLNRRMDALREAQMQKLEQRKQTAGETTV